MIKNYRMRRKYSDTAIDILKLAFKKMYKLEIPIITSIRMTNKIK